MDPGQPDHPGSDQLMAFGLGRLGVEEQRLVETHVRHCATCCVQLQNVPADHLTALVREAFLGSSPTPHMPGSGDGLPGKIASVPEIPKELTGHSRYQVESFLGAGGMGMVFKARHRLMQRPVALKVVNPAILHRPGAVERFRREVQAAAQLSNPHIVAAFDADEVGGVHFLAMEFIEGISLARLVAESGPLPVRLACDYMRQVALGLQHAHERGMVHRDIKPHNLILARDGQVKILDFGLARFLSESDPSAGAGASSTGEAQAPAEITFEEHRPARPSAGDESPGAETVHLAGEANGFAGHTAPYNALTYADAVMGSPGYSAPEQLASAHAADIRADVYGVGCTLYHLLVGRAPFPGSILEELRAHERAQPRPLADFRKDVPAELAAVLGRMLARDPAQRYQTPAEVAEALAPFAAAPVRRYRRWLTAVAAMLVLAAGLIALGRGARPTVQATAEAAVTPVRVIQAHAAGDGVWGAAFTPDGGRALSCGADGYVRAWSLATGRPLWVWACRPNQPCLRDLAVSPDGTTALVAVYDHTVRVLDMATGQEVRRFEGHRAKVHGVAFSADARLALSSGGTSHADEVQDDSIRLWEVATAREIRRLDGHTGWVRTAVLSPDGSTILSAGLDRTVRLWNAKTGKEVRRFIGHEEGVLGAAFLPDGQHALSNSGDGTMRLWDLSTGEELRRFEGHRGAVEAVAISRDGRRALSAGNDGTIRLWDLSTGRLLFQWKAHTGTVHSVTFSPDGKRALSGGADGTLSLLPLPEQGESAN
jgi:serine/threonine protein kinase